jgi:hypothetical protein
MKKESIAEQKAYIEISKKRDMAIKAKEEAFVESIDLYLNRVCDTTVLDTKDSETIKASFIRAREISVNVINAINHNLKVYDKMLSEFNSANVNVFDIGDTVLCDMCNKDFTNSNETGGFIFGSYAVCPDCAPRILKDVKKFNESENIKATCPEGVSFKNFILNWRVNN